MTTKGTIFLVEDDLNNLVFETLLLQMGGYQVTLARNGREVLQLLESNTPDLIITDMMMPEMNGSSLIARLQTDPRWRHIPVVILSAFHPEDFDWRAAGVRAYLYKPVMRNELFETLDAILAEQRAS